MADGSSEEHDLAGAMTEVQARDLIKAAFSDSSAKAIRITFVVGGGKLVRSRYDVDLAKWLTSELRALGYEEDRGAALGSAGVWKHQHDTGANLMYLHVFPKLAAAGGSGAAAGGAGSAAAGGAGSGSASAAAASPALVAGTPENTVLTCPQEQFKKAVASRVVSYAQKKRLHAFLADFVKRLEAHEATMVTSAKPLPPDAQAEYELCGKDDLAEKAAWLQGEMKAAVAAGALTAAEKEKVIASMEERAAAIKAELTAAAAPGGKALSEAKQTALRAAGADVAERRAALAAAPAVTHPVRNIAEIVGVLRSLEALDRLQRNIKAAGRLATVAEATELGRRLDLEPRLEELKAEARGWFEADDEFKTRLDAAVKAAAPKKR